MTSRVSYDRSLFADMPTEYQDQLMELLMDNEEGDFGYALPATETETRKTGTWRTVSVRNADMFNQGNGMSVLISDCISVQELRAWQDGAGNDHQQWVDESPEFYEKQFTYGNLYAERFGFTTRSGEQKFHRENGPAIIYYCPSDSGEGLSAQEHFFLYGTQLTSKEAHQLLVTLQPLSTEYKVVEAMFRTSY